MLESFKKLFSMEKQPERNLKPSSSDLHFVTNYNSVWKKIAFLPIVEDETCRQHFVTGQWVVRRGSCTKSANPRCQFGKVMSKTYNLLLTRQLKSLFSLK